MLIPIPILIPIPTNAKTHQYHYRTIPILTNTNTHQYKYSPIPIPTNANTHQYQYHLVLVVLVLVLVALALLHPYAHYQGNSCHLLLLSSKLLPSSLEINNLPGSRPNWFMPIWFIFCLYIGVIILRKSLRGFGPMLFLSKVMDILMTFRPMARGVCKNRMMKF